MMHLKLLGVLQDYGSPYASLYVDDASNVLYIAIQQDCSEPHYFSSLLLRVTKDMVLNYMQQSIGLRHLSQISSEKFLWHRKKGMAGTITHLGRCDLTEHINLDDDMFDSEFCIQQSSLMYYIDQIG